ncbi:hypothetical protein COU56_01400 [Candidatus Pacearchaeota archaeon CG10_big_fil_rev_8_21_14_0_10_31_9]|nr:MAG: hypothetical protein COU56_01400 [Candidatus Pacearchaeota archaeon CG10_big_fil_rev_8_21_14_0_10_31_9]
MKMNKLEKKSKFGSELVIKKVISIFEITLFIISGISFSFILSGYQINTDLKVEIISFFDLVPSVSAQSFPDLSSVVGGGNGCCFDSNEGLCTPNSDRNSCENEEDGQWFSSSSCEVNQCELGCCILGQEAQVTTERRCEKLEELNGIPGKFDSSVKDELACIGLADSQSEGACVIADNEGGENTCKFGTKTECQSIGGEFYENYLCSNAELNTNCEKQATTNCVENKDEIYWIDSCGNRENIYDSNKEKSWNNGKIFDKEDSCGAGNNNIRSQGCGNCDYSEGSLCAAYRTGEDKKKSDGDYVCRDLNCRDGLKIKKNGESWCVYDGKVGNGNDVVGSRHFRQLCVNGEVQTEPCADYRKEICVETSAAGNVVSSIKDIFGGDTNNAPQSFISEIQQQIGNLGNGGFSGGITGNAIGDILSSGLGGGLGSGSGLGGILGGGITGGSGMLSSFGSGSSNQNPDQSGAFCRPNMWEDCSGRKITNCMQNPDCTPKVVYVDSDFYFSACVPKYPPGNEFGKGGVLGGISNIGSGLTENLGGGALGELSSLGSGGEESICDAGTKTCTVVYEKKCPGGWKCVKNCNCEDYQFTLQMNNFCRTLGDCGAYTNIAGKTTDGGYSIKKEGGKAEKPPRLMGLEKLYAINAFSSGLSSITGSAGTGFYNNIQGLDLLGNFGIGDMFEGSSGDVSADDGQLGNMFSGGNAGGTIGGAALGGAAASSFAGATGIGAVGSGGAAVSVGGVTFSAGLVPAFAVGALAIVGVMYAMGCGKQEETDITFECKAWTQPTAGNCEFCNNDPDKPCSKYRCESLGSNCKIVNEGTGYDRCTSMQGEDGPPILSADEKALTEGYKYVDESNSGFKIKTSDGECVNPFSPITFGVETNVLSSCRYSDIFGESYEEMAGSFIEGEILSNNHTAMTFFPSVESIIASETNNPEEFSQATELINNNRTIYDSILDEAGDINLYIKCKNMDGVENVGTYEVNFCVKPGPDLTTPVVLATSPKSKSYVSKNTTSWTAVFFINEPAECKWDITDLGYFEMNESLSCENNLNDATIIGYPCVATLPLVKDENKFYVKCRDQPWLGENTSRNIGLGYEYVLKKTATDLIIDSISPSGTIKRGSETAQVDLIAETSGGVSSGESVCQYSINNQPYITFAQTLSNEHKQTFTSLNLGNYSVSVRCIDSAGNIASKNTSFTLEIDTTPPSITRIYYGSGELVIETDEDASCVYRNDSVTCNYNFANGTSMDFGNTKIHKADWSLKSISYIKCKDMWGNEPDECSAVVKPYQSGK